MSPGWMKVIALTAIALAGLVGLNLAMWRRLRIARRRGIDALERDSRP